MQSHQDTTVNLLVDGLEAVEVQLPFCRAIWSIIAVDVANRGREDIYISCDEVFNVGRGGEECCSPILSVFQGHDAIADHPVYRTRIYLLNPLYRQCHPHRR